jgi:hypothetical protein
MLAALVNAFRMDATHLLPTVGFAGNLNDREL